MKTNSGEHIFDKARLQSSVKQTRLMQPKSVSLTAIARFHSISLKFERNHPQNTTSSYKTRMWRPAESELLQLTPN